MFSVKKNIRFKPKMSKYPEYLEMYKAGDKNHSY